MGFSAEQVERIGRAYHRQWLGMSQATEQQPLILPSTAEGSLGSTKAERAYGERIGRSVSSILLLTDRYLREDPQLKPLGADLVDFNAERYRKRPRSLEAGAPPTAAELDSMYETLPTLLGSLPDRPRRDSEAKVRGAAYWVRVNRLIAADKPLPSVTTSFAETYGYPADTKEIPLIPERFIEQAITRLRRAFKRLTGMEFNRRALAFAQRFHPRISLFSAKSWDELALEMSSWKLGDAGETVPKTWDELSPSVRQILHDAFLRCRSLITNQGELVVKRMRARYGIDVDDIGTAIAREYKNDYWTCRTEQREYSNVLYLNTFRLLFTLLPRIQHLGGHELVHFWVMMARARRYDAIDTNPKVIDKDIYPPDLLALIPSAEQVMQEGFAEMYPYFLGEEPTPEEEFSVNFAVASHFLYYNALLKVELAGSDVQKRTAVRAENAREISRRLGIGFDAAILEQRYKDLSCFDSPREKRRAARALLYRGGAYTLGVLLGTLLMESFKKLGEAGYDAAMQRIGYFMITRGTTPEIIIREAQRIAPAVIDPDRLLSYFYSDKVT